MECRLSVAERTYTDHRFMSASDPKRTSSRVLANASLLKRHAGAKVARPDFVVSAHAAKVATERERDALRGLSCKRCGHSPRPAIVDDRNRRTYRKPNRIR